MSSHELLLSDSESKSEDDSSKRSSCSFCLSFCALAAFSLGIAFKLGLVGYCVRLGVASTELEILRLELPMPRTVLQPRVEARAARPSPVDAEIWMSELHLMMKERVLGRLKLPKLKLEARRDLILNLSSWLFIDDLNAFAQAGKEVVQGGESSWTVTGQLTVHSEILGVPITLSNISFRKTLSLKGMDSFSQAEHPVEVERFIEAEGFANGLETSLQVRIYNPSLLATRLVGPFRFHVTQNDEDFGTAELSEVVLQPGTCHLSLSFRLQAPEKTLQDFITGYLAAEVQAMVVHGSKRSSDNFLLATVLEGLLLAIRFQPPRDPLVRHIDADVGLTQMQVTSWVKNPLPQVIVLGAMDLSIREHTTAGEEIFRLKGNATSGLGGRQLAASAEGKLKLSLATLDANLGDLSLLGRLIEDAVGGQMVVGVSGPLSLTISPHFGLTLQYEANNITAHLSCLVVCGSASMTPATWFTQQVNELR